jgi:hypothetical protein
MHEIQDTILEQTGEHASVSLNMLEYHKDCTSDSLGLLSEPAFEISVFITSNEVPITATIPLDTQRDSEVVLEECILFLIAQIGIMKMKTQEDSSGDTF